MQFRTQVPICKSKHPIDYNSKIISLGSCFAVNMAEKLDYYKFQNFTNPFGIIFNPVSIEKMVQRLLNQELFSKNDIFFHHDLWHCYEVHSECSHSNKDFFLHNLNQILEKTNRQLTDSTHLIITYGTSWIYRNITTNEIVANCHKVPQKEFIKELLSVEAIQKSIQNTIDLIHSVNPNVKLIFTISPVRHIKDGFVENQLSKSHLFTAIYEVLKRDHLQFTTHTYFPSYEIMMDELRDYRFYDPDMLHPNQVAIDYIWEKFAENFIAEDSFSVVKEVSEIQKGLAHRSFNPDSEQYRTFLSKLQLKIDALEQKHPHIKF